MTVDKGYLAGSASLLVLSLLEKEDQYGYQIIRRLEERSQKVFSLQEGTLYPVLHKLENKGYITSYEQQAPTGRMRKYYRITPEGLQQLVEEKKRFVEFAGAVRQVMGGGLCETGAF